MSQMVPQAEAVIDLDAYRANLETLRSCAPNALQMAVVKADAYGHGLAPIARAARQSGADWLGVATSDEALALRAAGDRGPVLCWLNAPNTDYRRLLAADIEVTASSAEQLREILDQADGRVNVQLKVDTGLLRNGAFGSQWDRLVEAAKLARDRGVIDVTGVWSHLACADDVDHPVNREQERVFRSAIEQLADVGIEPPLQHLANSAATLQLPSTHFSLVRVGIASYGIDTALGVAKNVRLHPVMTLRAQAVAVKRVPAGRGVSYGHTYVTPKETTLVDVPLGYGDGILRSASGHAHVAVAGQRYPVAGRICMDQFVVDVGDAQVTRGDTVIVFGPGTDGEPLATDWADAAGTIGYEVVTRLGGRITRTYRGVQ